MSKIKAVLFDLDGTLLPMDQDVFLKDYFKRLALQLAPYGYDPKALIDAVMKGTYAMIQNQGEATNETVFWNNSVRAPKSICLYTMPSTAMNSARCRLPAVLQRKRQRLSRL